MKYAIYLICGNIADFNFAERTFDIVECALGTGRTHQIRVHFASIGHPLLGDTLYGSSSPFISRQALHCYIMGFIHPITKENVLYTAHVPDVLRNVVTIESR